MTDPLEAWEKESDTYSKTWPGCMFSLYKWIAKISPNLPYYSVVPQLQHILHNYPSNSLSLQHILSSILQNNFPFKKCFSPQNTYFLPYSSFSKIYSPKFNFPFQNPFPLSLCKYILPSAPLAPFSKPIPPSSISNIFIYYFYSFSGPRYRFTSMMQPSCWKV